MYICEYGCLCSPGEDANPTGLDLQTVVRYPKWVLGAQPQSFLKSSMLSYLLSYLFSPHNVNFYKSKYSQAQ